MFSLYGILDDQVVELAWDGGKLTGDPVAVARVEAEAQVRVRVGPPTGPFTEGDHLSDPFSALLLIDAVLDEIGVLDGDIPEAPGAEEDEDAEVLF